MQLGPLFGGACRIALTLAFMVAAFIGERLAPMWPSEPCRAAAPLAAFAAFMSAGAAISAAPGTTAAEVAAEGLLIGAPMALTLMAWGKTLGANRRASPLPKSSPLRALPRHAASRCGLRQRKSVWHFGACCHSQAWRSWKSPDTSKAAPRRKRCTPPPLNQLALARFPPACSQVLLSLAWPRASLRLTEATPARFPRQHSPMPCSSWLCSAAAFWKRCAPQVSAIHSRRATASRSRSCSPAFCLRPCS